MVNLTKIVIEIYLVDSIGSKLVAKILERGIKASLKSTITHPSIEKVESRVE